MKGSLEKHGSSWRMRVTVGYNQKGNPIRRSRMAQAKNKREAQKELALFIAEIEAGEYIKPEKILFKHFVEEWREKHALSQLSPKTVAEYMEKLNKNVIPVIGEKKIEDIKTFHIVDLLSNLESQIGNTSLINVYYALKNIFERAVKWGIVLKNPLDRIDTPKRKETKSKDAFTLEEVQLILEVLQQEKEMYQVLYSMAIFTGLRRGELLGLEWKHIELDKGIITVEQSLKSFDGKYEISEPKTKTSRRTITLPNMLIEPLKKYKKRCNEERLLCGELWKEGKHFLVFSKWDGTPYLPGTISKHWLGFLRKNSIRELNFHCLRHTSISLLIEAGERLDVVSKRSGHASIKTTIDTYNHIKENADKRASNRFDVMFAKNTNQKDVL